MVRFQSAKWQLWSRDFLSDVQEGRILKRRNWCMHIWYNSIQWFLGHNKVLKAGFKKAPKKRYQYIWNFFISSLKIQSCSWIQSIAWRQLWNASLNISDWDLKSCTIVREEQELCIEQSFIYRDLNFISHMGGGGRALSFWKNLSQRYILLLRVTLMHLIEPAEF